MPKTTTAQGAGSADASAEPTKPMRALLACGIAAGPLYIAVAGVQALARDGFDITRHPVSLLSTGDLGWVQIANFVVTGLLTVACAVGMRRALRDGRGAVWAPRLIGVYGLGVLAAGIFVPDPMDGFPGGTPAGPAEIVTWHGTMHFVVGGIGFLALIAACLVLARRFAGLDQRGWAAYSAATGVIFFAAFVGIASGSAQPAVNIAFGVAVVLAWAWLAAMAARLMTRPAS